MYDYTRRLTRKVQAFWTHCLAVKDTYLIESIILVYSKLSRVLFLNHFLSNLPRDLSHYLDGYDRWILYVLRYFMAKCLAYLTFISRDFCCRFLVFIDVFPVYRHVLKCSTRGLELCALLIYCSAKPTGVCMLRMILNAVKTSVVIPLRNLIGRVSAGFHPTWQANAYCPALTTLFLEHEGVSDGKVNVDPASAFLAALSFLTHKTSVQPITSPVR